MNSLVLAPTTIPDASPLDYIAAAAAAGFTSVGLRLNRSPGLPFQPVVGDAKLIRSMKEALRSAGIGVLDIYSFYLEPDTNVASFAPALELGAEFGARLAVCMGTDPEWSRLRDNFASLCRLAAGFGLVCAVEPAVIRPLANLQQSLRLVTESGCDNVAICIDPLNFARAGDTVSALRQVDPKLLPYAQITDGIIGPDEPNPALLGRMGPNQRRMPGEGNVPLADILRALPPGIPLSIELPPPGGSRPDAAHWATLVLARTYEWLERHPLGTQTGQSHMAHRFFTSP